MFVRCALSPEFPNTEISTVRSEAKPRYGEGRFSRKARPLTVARLRLRPSSGENGSG